MRLNVICDSVFLIFLKFLDSEFSHVNLLLQSIGLEEFTVIYTAIVYDQIVIKLHVQIIGILPFKNPVFKLDLPS